MEKLMKFNFDKKQIGENVILEGILATEPHQNIFTITDYSDNIKVFIQFGSNPNFDFATNLNRRVKIEGKIIPVGNTQELGILLSSISETSVPKNDEKFNALETKIQGFVENLKNTIKVITQNNMYDGFNPKADLTKQLEYIGARTCSSHDCFVLNLMIQELTKILKSVEK